MNTQTFLALNEDFLSSLVSEPEVLSVLSGEIEKGINEDDFVINSFKVEQRIIQLESKTSLNIGGFVNGNSDIKNLKIRYLLALYSNKFASITDSLGRIIRRRYGYGFGFTLNITDIDTKVSANFASLAASAALGLTRIGYEINAYGVHDAALAEFMPERTGEFSSSVYKKLQNFIIQAKKTLKDTDIDDINDLYPIEVLNEVSTNFETSDVKSIYFGVWNVVKGVTLNDALIYARRKKLDINENVIQFIYGYFEIKNAYIEPGSIQKDNAQKWLEGKYNKRESQNDSWVTIDPTIENGKFIALSHLANAEEYQPHPVPDDWNEIGKTIKDKYSEISLDFSSTLKLSSIIDTSPRFNTLSITRDISLFVDVSSNPPAGSKVIETRYGIGIRLILRISNIEFGTKINYNIVGAASELNHANVEFELSGIGISDLSLFDLLPEPQDITQDSMASINKAFDDVRVKLSQIDVSHLNPQPFMIRVNEPEKIDPMLHAQSVVYSIRKIAERKSSNKAMSEGQNLGIDKQTIIDTYQSWGIANLPSNEDRNKAKNWLEI